MNTEFFVSLIGNLSLDTLLKQEHGVFSDAVARFPSIPTVPQSAMPIFTKVASMSAVLEKANADWANAVRAVKPSRLVVVAEYVLSAAPSSALEGSRLMQEVEQVFISGGDAAAELETVLVALQVLEHLWNPAIADPDEDRTRQIEQHLAGNVVPTQPKQTEQPAPASSIKVNTLGDLLHANLGDVNLYEYTRELLKDEDTLYDDLSKRYEQFTKSKKKKKKWQLSVSAVINYLYDYKRYIGITSNILPGLSSEGGAQGVAVMYERFERERGNRMATLDQNRAALLEMCPDANEVFQLMESRAGYCLNPADSKESEVLVLIERIRENGFYKDLYPLVKRMEKLGAYVPEANLHAAVFYKNLIEQKAKDAKDSSTIYHYGGFDDELCFEHLQQLVARYFLMSHQRGGAAYADCVFNLFHVYVDVLGSVLFQDVEHLIIAMAETVEEEHAVADFLTLVRTFDFVSGIQARKGRLYAKMLKRHKAPNDPNGQKRKITTIVYASIVALVAILYPIVLNTPIGETPLYTLSNILWIIGIPLVLAAQTVAMRYANGFEKWLRFLPPVAIPIALIVHYLTRYGFTAPHSFWPGSPNSLFGPSFVVPCLIFAIAAFLAPLKFTTLRRCVQVTLAYHPVLLILLTAMGVFTKITAASLCLDSAYKAFSFGSLFGYIIPVALSLCFSVVLFMAERPRFVFGNNARYASAFSLVFTVIAAMCSAARLSAGEPSHVLDFPYRLAIMQALFQLPIYFILNSSFESVLPVKEDDE